MDGVTSERGAGVVIKIKIIHNTFGKDCQKLSHQLLYQLNCFFQLTTVSRYPLLFEATAAKYLLITAGLVASKIWFLESYARENDFFFLDMITNIIFIFVSDAVKGTSRKITTTIGAFLILHYCDLSYTFSRYLLLCPVRTYMSITLTFKTISRVRDICYNNQPFVSGINMC